MWLRQEEKQRDEARLWLLWRWNCRISWWLEQAGDEDWTEDTKQ